MKLKKVKSKIPGATEISPSCSAAVYRMGREEITHNAIWFHPQCTLDGMVYMCEYCVCVDCVKGGGVFCNWKITKCQDLPKFEFPKGVGVFCNWKITKYQDLPKYEFFLGGGYSATKKSKCQDFWQFSWGGYSSSEKSQSAKIYLNLNFGGGGVFCN